MSSDNNSSRALSDVNSATLGTKFPEITLPDGTKVQTGTVGALLVNIRSYNTAHTAGDIAQMKALKSSFEAALPLLDRVGLFDLFTPDKWVQGENKGCKVVR